MKNMGFLDYFKISGTGELPWWVRALAAPAGDPGYDALFWPLCAPAC